MRVGRKVKARMEVEVCVRGRGVESNNHDTEYQSPTDRPGTVCPQPSIRIRRDRYRCNQERGSA